jgi:hypothetical protein
MCSALWIALGIPLIYAIVTRWPKEANAAGSPGSAGSGGSTNIVAQESKGTNSPNIVGNNNVVNISPTSKPTPSKGKLKVEDRSSEDTADGIRETIIFGNTGSGDTYLVALRVRDRANEQVAVYRRATGKVEPGLPVTIRPGNSQAVTIQLTKDEGGRAHWIEWQSENNKWEGLPWNKGLHHYKVEVSEAMDHSATVDARPEDGTRTGGTKNATTGGK